MRIAVLSDTHGLLPEDLDRLLAPAEHILHLGDVGPLRLLDEISALAPLTAVQGNNDAAGLPNLPPERLWRAEGLTLQMRHHPWIPGRLPVGDGPRLFLHGHTHRPALKSLPEGRLLCPGSVNLPRGGFPPSMAWIHLEGGMARIRVRSLEGGETLFGEDWRYA